MRSLLLLAGALGATGAHPGLAKAQDESALLQANVRAHSSASGGLAPLVSLLAQGMGRQLTAASLEYRPFGKLFARRAERRAESLDFSLAGCEGGCGLSWGSVVEMKAAMHLTDGLKWGEQILFSMATRMEGSQLVHSSGSVACSVCQDSCVISMGEQVTNFQMDMTYPSNIFNSSFCGDLTHMQKVDLPLLDYTFFLPPLPPGALQSSASLAFTVEVQKADGTVRLSKTIDATIAPPSAGSASMLQLESSRTFAELLESTLREAPRRFQEMAAVAKSSKSSGAAKTKLSAFYIKVELKDLEQVGQNFSLTAGESCKKQGGKTSCIFPFDRPSDASLEVHLAYSSQPGAAALLRVTPKVGGMLGVMAGPLLKPSVERTPLCGREQWKDYGPCGFHALNLKAPVLSLALPDLGSLNFKDLGVPLPPFVPATMAEMPPMSEEISVSMYHGNGALIGTLNMELGMI